MPKECKKELRLNCLYVVVTNREVEILEHFLVKTSMWIHPINEISIVSFMHGFEAGIDSKLFTSELKEFLQKKYNIFGSSQGWPRQIFLYAQIREIDWHVGFLEVGRIVLEQIKKGNH